MKQSIFEIEENKSIAKNTMKMILSGDVSQIKKAGQFVNIKIDGFFLRRPISVCEACGDKLTLIYKIVGKGTEALAEMKKGARLDLLTGLGNGYDTSKSGASPVLIGGGAGVPPMYELAKRLLAEGKDVQAVLGFNSSEEIFLKEEFEELGAKTYVTTADGSAGTRGFVTDVLKNLDYTYFYACGPENMFRAIQL